ALSISVPSEEVPILIVYPVALNALSQFKFVDKETPLLSYIGFINVVHSGRSSVVKRISVHPIAYPTLLYGIIDRYIVVFLYKTLKKSISIVLSSGIKFIGSNFVFF